MTKVGMVGHWSRNPIMISRNPSYWGCRPAVRPGGGQAVTTGRLVQVPPGNRDQPEPTADEQVTGQVKRRQVRVTAPPDEIVPQMSAGVGRLRAWHFGAEPAGQQIHRQRDAVHLGEQRGKNAVKAPIARQSRRVRGWKKLAAKTTNSAVLMITNGHRP
jgi:hypothetical protein